MTTTITKKNTGQRVDTKHVDELISTYKKDRWIVNSRILGKPDSLSTWYGLEQMSDFLALARRHKADGIKMYFAVYPSTMNVPAEFHGRQTVVLVATKTTTTGYGTTNKDIYLEKDGRSVILAFNFGSICPPSCGSDQPPGEGNEWGFCMEKIGLSVIEDKGKIIII